MVAMKKLQAKIYQVGGSIRDEILGVDSKDKDYVVIGATPEMMISAGFILVGKDFPVFLHPETKQEYTLARTEKKTGIGYRGFLINCDPSISLSEDLLRRDLTINAIAKDVDSGEIIDEYGGIDDLRAGVLKPVSSAFSEDPLRLLRACRFSATLSKSFVFSEELIEQCKNISASGELLNLSYHRIVNEYKKALSTQKYYIFFENLALVDALHKLHKNLF